MSKSQPGRGPVWQCHYRCASADPEAFGGAARVRPYGPAPVARASPVAPELHCHQCIPPGVGTSSAAASRQRILRDLLLGAVLGGIGAALVWQLYPGFWKESPAAAQDLALQRRAQEEAQQQAARAALAAARPVTPPATCELDPLIAPAGAQDGQASVEHPFPGGPRARAKVFVAQAEAALARGRPRDAEVALLAACREHDVASARPTVPLARVLAMLGERYAVAARAEASPALREQLQARARHVLGLSAQAYAVALGPNASRSRQARQRLASLEQDLVAGAQAPQPGSDDRLQDEAAPAAKVASVRSGATAPRPARQQAAPGPAARKPDPEPVATVASLATDPELRQLASDLARLRAQAEAVSEDPAGFRQRAERARSRRDQCQDASCLRAWYAQRRRELLAEF
jgi:hypothetical protein